MFLVELISSSFLNLISKQARCCTKYVLLEAGPFPVYGFPVVFSPLLALVIDFAFTLEHY